MHPPLAVAGPHRQAALRPRDGRQRRAVIVAHHRRRGTCADTGAGVGADDEGAQLRGEQRVQGCRRTAHLLDHFGAGREAESGDEGGAVASLEQW